MKIAIPSAGRANRQTTINFLPKSRLEDTTLFIPNDQYTTYTAGRKIRELGINVVTHDRFGMSPTRNFILDHYTGVTDKIVMLDDDLKFFHRESPDDISNVKLLPNSNSDTEEMFGDIASLLDFAPYAGISARQENRLATGYTMTTRRQYMLYAYRLDWLNDMNIRFYDENLSMSDFDVALQIMSLGCTNHVNFYYAIDQQGSNAVGGCSVYRTPEFQKKSAEHLKEKWPEYVRVAEKETKGGWFTHGKHGKNQTHIRTDVRVSWKKAAQDGARLYPNASDYFVNS